MSILFLLATISKLPLGIKSQNPFALHILNHIHLHKPFFGKHFIARDSQQGFADFFDAFF